MVADRLIAGREHRQDELLRLALRQCSRDVLGRNARCAHQRHAEAGHVQRIAGVAPERAARSTQRTDIRVIADVAFQEVENLLRIVVELGRFFLDVRIADRKVRRIAHVGGVGVRRRTDQAGIAGVARLQRRGGSGVRDGAGVERGEGLGARVELHAESRRPA